MTTHTKTGSATRTRNRKSTELAEAIKAQAEAEVAEVIELKVANRKARSRKAPAAKVEEPTPAPKARRTRKSATPTTPESATGYTVRWPHAGYDLLKSDGTHDGAAWLVRCNAHGTEVPAANAKAGDLLGRKAERATWCAECGAAS